MLIRAVFLLPLRTNLIRTIKYIFVCNMRTVKGKIGDVSAQTSTRVAGKSRTMLECQWPLPVSKKRQKTKEPADQKKPLPDLASEAIVEVNLDAELVAPAAPSHQSVLYANLFINSRESVV